MAVVGGSATIVYAIWMLIATPPIPMVLAILIYLLAAIGVGVVPVSLYLWAHQRKTMAPPSMGAAMLVDRHGTRVAYTEGGINGITAAYDKHGNLLDQIYVKADANPGLGGGARLPRDEDPD